MLKQVAQVYQSVSMKRLLALAKFSTHHHLERLVVECARNNDMQVTWRTIGSNICDDS